jgi:AcrR family transcriptional regulator
MPLQPGKRTINSQRVKRRIYDCAIKLFRQYGYENVSVEDIAKVSKTSIGSFYHHFKSKDELPILFLQTYLQSAFEEYEEQKLPLFRNSNVPLIDQLCDFLLFALQLPHEGGEEFLRMAMLHLLRETSSEISYNYIFNPERPYARICRQLIREGQETGEFRNDLSADELFMRISIFSNGIDQQCYLQHEKVDVLEAYGDYLTDFARRILLRNPNE